ncbi:MAG: MBL fold metallo-hydrolase [Alicyclobacillaceae bacterium]|nr:MBL fold metallo-hydrolase [Alicyclobacillaceae bacterium]MCY0896074.1 MBL fold metallo-hydrolase [Alicyclobacillaceae bacterium]
MLLKYFYDTKLAQASYLVGCQKTGEAIVVDPARDITPYLATAKAEGLRIVGAAETHIHADFVSGARELAEQGATLYLSDEGGEGWHYEYAKQYHHVPLKDGSVFTIGNIRFEVLHTPGHTPEHISFVVTDGGNAQTSQQPLGIFSGDFVFVGDVGRPDLLEKAAGVSGSTNMLAKKMFESLQRFKMLPDFLQLWPGHGAGSACGKALGAIPSSTVGYEKMTNWALQTEDEATFVTNLLAGQPEPPRYFAKMKEINRMGPTLLSSVGVPDRSSVDWKTAVHWASEGTLLDVRKAVDFASAHIRGSINIPANKSFVTWAGWLLPYDQPIYLLAEESTVEAILHDLSSIGLDNVAGIMDSSVVDAAPPDSDNISSYQNVSVEEARDRIASGAVHLVDVRNLSEWQAGHVATAHHHMLGELLAHVGELPRNKPILLQCQTGGRSAIASSLLTAHGFSDVENLAGGYEAWRMSEQKAAMASSVS